MLSKQRHNVQSGFSLIEILISLIVLSIGLLGLAGLQLTSMQSTNSAHRYSIASMHVAELANRMRINPLAVSSALYEKEITRAFCNNDAPACEGNNLCSSSEAAAYDLNTVACGRTQGTTRSGGVFYQLPESFLSVNCGVMACGTGVEHTIIVGWSEADDDGENADLHTRSYELSFTP